MTFAPENMSFRSTIPYQRLGLIGISLLAMSCRSQPEDDQTSFLERGIYQSEATGDEILIGDIDAYLRFGGEKRTVAGFDAKDGGTLVFSPVSGREDAFESSSASKASWTWEPGLIRQVAIDGTVLQAFTIIHPE